MRLLEGLLKKEKHNDVDGKRNVWIWEGVGQAVALQNLAGRASHYAPTKQKIINQKYVISPNTN